MKFTLTHHFATTLARFEEVLFSAELEAFIVTRMPGVKAIEVLEHHDDGATVRRRRRFIPNPPASLPVFARGVKPEMMQWVEESVFERSKHRFTYENVPNIPPAYRSYFVNRGAYELVEERPGRVRRTITGDLTLKIPLIGGLGERLIWKEAERNFESEAKGLQEWLSREAPPSAP